MNASPQRRVAMSLLAHPDDAEILCAGTLIRLADAGWQIHIATVANGDCGSATLGRKDIAAIRRQEGIAAAAKIGATYHCLEEPDVHVTFDKSTISKVIDLLRRVAPKVLFTHPRHDYMLDHEQVHLLARAGAFSYPIPNASSLPLIDGSAIPWLYYCDPVEGHDPYTGELVPPTTCINISAQIERKTEMLACHASQRDWLRAHHGMDEYIESMKRFSSERGQQIGATFAEAFVLHRGHPFPTSDLLTQLFSK
ncbi:MAG TPA: PIG-L deacetylase family protein [Lacipirellulaceae bacterium]|jgi:LmbE family N-acetylglucosaminyl deacetylase|nr:PIG-L deacetylase family protein [Lacipirellulaceae bacterium]